MLRGATAARTTEAPWTEALRLRRVVAEPLDGHVSRARSIAVDRHHRFRRRQIGDVVYDFTEEGILISFAVVDDEVVYLKFLDLSPECIGS